ncbi:MAG TPA: VIT1/CCC1 transporter family protein [Candidatus Paceibacterota bacterium]|nr:VIT1/CCC1 transporter family protein [Candidatus Paceibacterota bacterium]
MQNVALYIRTIVFGITDSLVSMVGLLAGLNVGGASREIVVLTGVVYAFVEAFSMAVGNFLSEESAEEYTAKAQISSGPALIAGVVMFVASVLAAFIPLTPYLFLQDGIAFGASVVCSILSLFIAGGISARLAKLPFLKRALRMSLLGGAAIVIGVIVGSFLPAS